MLTKRDILVPTMVAGASTSLEGNARGFRTGGGEIAGSLLFFTNTDNGARL